MNFRTDEDKPTGMMAQFILWEAYRWTDDTKYVQPSVDSPLESLLLVNSDILDTKLSERERIYK